MTAKPWEHAQGGEGSADDPLAARFVASLDYDQRLYKHDIAGSIAHARMLAHVGLITDEDLAAIERGLNEIGTEIEEQGEDWPGWKIELEDVHMCIEAALIQKVGDPGRKLHTGRSRNDQVATDLCLWLTDADVELSSRLTDLIAAFVALAEREGHAVMPAFTHLQRAQPIVCGAELLAWAEMFNYDRGRLTHLLGSGTANVEQPLGSGAIAGSSLPLDADYIGNSLGGEVVGGPYHALYFGGPPQNSIERTASRDNAIDFVYACSMVAMHLSRWAEQWIIYASQEFGFITLDRRYTTGSSMMPQKQNPDMLELIRGRCGGVYGHLVALLTMCKGLTIGYNRDLQEDKRHVFAAYDTVSDCLEMAARIVRTTRFNEDRIRAGLDRGFLDATSLAEYLVTRGVPFRTAHQIVGGLVRTCQQRGLYKLEQLALEDFNAACREAGQAGVCDEHVYEWLGPDNVVKRYRTAGNAGVSGFRQQLAAWKQRAATEGDTQSD